MIALDDTKNTKNVVEIEHLRKRIAILEASKTLTHQTLARNFRKKEAELGTANENLQAQIHQQKIVEEALRISEQNFRLLAETSQALIYVFDPSTMKTLYVNPAFEVLLGYSQEESFKINPLNIVHPEERNVIENRALKRLRGENVASHYETRFIHKDRRILWGDVSASRIVFDRLQAILVVGYDITDRVEATQALKKSEMIFRNLSETLPALMYVLQDNRMVYFNSEFCRISGYSREELEIMDDHSSLIHPDSRQLTVERGAARLRGEPVPPRYESKILRKDGKTVILDLSSSLVEFNARPAIIAVGYDISGQKAAEVAREEALKALQASELTFRTLSDTAPILIWVIDAETGKFRYINSHFSRITGYGAEECMEMSVWNLIHPDYRQIVQDRAQFRQRGGNPIARYECKLLRKDGVFRWMDLNSTRLVFNGEPSTMGLAIDVTERKEAEEKLSAALREIRGTNARLASLNDELIAKNNEMEAMNEELQANYTEMEAMNEELQANYNQIEAMNEELQASYNQTEAMNEELQANYNQLEAMNIELKTTNEEIARINEELRHSQQQVWAINEELLKSQVELILVNERLKENEERLELALWAANEGMWDLDIARGTYHINELGLNMLGYSPEEYSLNQELVASLLHPNDHRETIKVFNDHVSGKTDDYAAEYRLKLPDGRYIWLWAKGRAVQRDMNGQATRIIGLFRDISERKHLEENLQNSQRRYQELFEQSPVGLLKCNASGVIVDVNRNYIDLFGFASRHELMQYNVFLTSNKPLVSLAEHLGWVFSSGIGIDTESQSKTNDGKNIWVHYKINPVVDGEGHVIEVVVACEDITIRKMAEDKIRYLSFNDSLTGVHNRAYLDQAMQSLNSEDQMPLSIIMGDVNGLKLVNDAFGHNTGDEYLQEIAMILKKCCRPGDILARWGGDEFVILLPQTRLETASQICDEIRSCCQSADIFPIKPSIALGAQVKHIVDKDIYEVLGEAEDTMYRNKLLETTSIRNSIVSSLSATLHERTQETKEHTERLQVLSTDFGKKLGLPAHEVDKLSLFAALHDIGKMGIPDDILSKPGPLNESEWEIIKKHPEIGYRITQASHELSAVALDILAHHEHWDGKGYPKGLAGEEIPFLARILAIIDAYDVMTNERPYKHAMTHREAVHELKRCSGSQFEPYLVDKFLAIFENGFSGGDH